MSETKNAIVNVDMGGLVKDLFLNYSQEVLLSRALTKSQDGLKPVQRYTLYALNEMGLKASAKTRKSAKVVGHVIGSYSPHGDTSAYEALVGLSQPWKKRYPLVFLQGNQGNIDGDGPAAMRYTECKLTKIGESMLDNINKDTVRMLPNYDNTTVVPEVLTGLFPQGICNGTEGVAVGTASSMLPHYASDVFKAIKYVLNSVAEGNQPDINEVISIIKAPDFPTGGIITNPGEVRRAYREGRGRVVVRARHKIEDLKGNQQQIVFTEIPYGITKSNIVSKIADKVYGDNPDKVLHDSIADISDESAKGEIRIVVKLKRNVNANLVLNNLFIKTPLQKSCSINNTVIIKGRPEENVNLLQLIQAYCLHQMQVKAKATKFDLNAYAKRLEIVTGFIKLNDIVDEVIKTIRESESHEAVIANLVKTHGFTEPQAKAIDARRLGSLNKMDLEALNTEVQELNCKITACKYILANRSNLVKALIGDIDAYIARGYFKNDTRRTDIEETSEDIDDRDLVKEEDIVLFYTHNGTVKALKSSDYNSQARNGVGSCIQLREDDFVEKVLNMSNKDNLLVISSKGKAYLVPAFKIPIVSKAAAGKYLNNYVEFEENETVMKVLAIKHEDTSHNLLFCSRKGYAKQLELKGLTIRRNGIKVVRIEDDDELVSVVLVEPDTQVMFTTHDGFAYRTSTDNIPVQSRTGRGSTGMRFKSEDDYVVSVTNVKEDDTVLVVSESGVGKRMAANTVRESSRGSKGIQINKKNPVCAVLTVAEDEDIIIVTSDNMVIRTPAASVSEQSRTSQGVKLVKLNEGAKIATVTAAPAMEEESKEEEVA